MTKPPPEQFAGFASPNYTQVPDEFFDQLLATLSGSEVKVLLYIFRRTFGFKKDADDISLKQICEGIVKRDGERMDSGTGLSKSTAVTAIKSLVDRGIIVTARNTDIEQGDQPTTYKLRFAGEKDRTPVSENQTGGVPKDSTPRVRKSNTQETVLQQTVNKRLPILDFGELDPVRDRALIVGNRDKRPEITPAMGRDPQQAAAWLDAQRDWDVRWGKGR
jgi:hypothetical protein